MHPNKYAFALIIVGIIFFSGCAIKYNSKNTSNQDNLTQDEFITVKGIANETKDGYYIGEYVLEHSEIQKYDADYVLSEYHSKNLELTGREKEVEMPCETPSGEISQCREGTYKIIYDVQSIKTIK